MTKDSTKILKLIDSLEREFENVFPERVPYQISLALHSLLEDIRDEAQILMDKCEDVSDLVQILKDEKYEG